VGTTDAAAMSLHLALLPQVCQHTLPKQASKSTLDDRRRLVMHLHLEQERD
jgi:hypothetical protein